MYIIGTVGPNVKNRTILKGTIDSGVNMLRFNFIHGSSKEFYEFFKLAKEIKSDIKIMIDLSGTKVRVSNKFKYIYKVYDQEIIYFCGEDKYEEFINLYFKSHIKIIPLNIKHKFLCEKEYSKIGIKDNSMLFNIIKNTDNDMIKSITLKGGVIRSGKGCNIKDLERKNLSLTTKDKEAIKWGIDNKADIICQSFVEDRSQIKEIKELIRNANVGEYEPKLWAKIETLNGINNISDILQEADGIIIGRGDMIPETSIEDTPIHEEKIINEVLKIKNKDIIIATHLLNTMKDGKIPSISEVESIYNFIKGGVTGFLLAGETSVGKAPIKTVKFLNKLILKYTVIRRKT